MNALYTGEERDAENMVLHLIQKVMTSDAVRVKGVSQVQYIGDRETYHVPVPPSSIDSGGDAIGTPMRSFALAIGIAVGAAIMIGLIVGMLVARMVRKRSSKDPDSDTRMSVTSIEMILELDEENKGDKEDTNVQITPSVAEEGNANVGIEVQEVQQDTSVLPAPLPQQSQSLPSKRRRRKKKKKKKVRMVLTRSNSVNSMDTITEENEEEDSDDGSDFGSEYSTDDEDQDIGLRRTMSTGSLTTDPSLTSLSFPLEQVKESPRIKRLPPPPV